MGFSPVAKLLWGRAREGQQGTGSLGRASPEPRGGWELALAMRLCGTQDAERARAAETAISSTASLPTTGSPDLGEKACERR